MHEFLREMNDKVLKHYDALTVGELPHTPDPKKVLDYVGASDKQLSMVFQFDIVDIGQGVARKYQFEPWKLPLFKGIVAKWQQFIEGTDGWTTAFCENHGTPQPPGESTPQANTPQTKAAPSPASPPTPPSTASFRPRCSPS